MKILFVVDGLKVGGGITTALYNVIKECFNHNIKVDLLSLSMNEQIPNDLKNYCTQININDNNLRYINLSKKDLIECKNIYSKIKIYLLGFIKKIMTRIGCWIKLVLFISPELGPYDVAIAYRQGPIYSGIVNNIKTKKRVGFMHGDVSDMYGIEKWIKNYSKFDKIACVSNAVQKSFEKRFPYYASKACTVYNMFDPKQIVEKANLKEFNIIKEDNQIILVTLSRLSVDKGVNRIPEICKNLVRKCGHGSFKWYVLGDGELYESLINETKKKNLETTLFFEGVKSNPYKYLKQSDAMVLLTFSEGYPMSVIETLILKKPVITTRYSAVEEMVKDGIDGLIIEDNTIDSITYCLSKFILDEDLRMYIQEGASNYIYDELTPWQQFMDEIIEI